LKIIASKKGRHTAWLDDAKFDWINVFSF